MKDEKDKEEVLSEHLKHVIKRDKDYLKIIFWLYLFLIVIGSLVYLATDSKAQDRIEYADQFYYKDLPAGATPTNPWAGYYSMFVVDGSFFTMDPTGVVSPVGSGGGGGGGAGDVTGPAASIVNQVAQYEDTTGKLIKATAWTVPNAIGTLNQYLTVVGGQDTAWTSLPTSLVYVGGAPVVAGNVPAFGGTAGTQIVDSGILATKVAYRASTVAGGVVPSMTDNTTPVGYTAFGSGGVNAWWPFNTAGFMETAYFNPTTYGIELPNPVSIISYTFMTPGNTMRPSTWTIQGSNDGVAYTVLDTKTGMDLSPSIAYLYNLAGPSLPYKFFKMVVTASGITGSPSGENRLRLLQFNSAPSPSTLAIPLLINSASGSTDNAYIASPYSMPSTLGTVGQVLTATAGTNAVWATPAGGGGDVAGPATSVANTPAIFADTTGKLLSNGTIDLFNMTPGLADPAYQEGRVFFDDTAKSLSMYSDVTGAKINLGQALWFKARNTSGVSIPLGSAVRVTGAAGNRPTIAMALADTTANARAIGITAQTIANNADGFVNNFGAVRGLNTSAFVTGDLLYLSSTVAGGFTTTAPTIKTTLGRVLNAHATQGIIGVSAYNNIVTIPTCTAGQFTTADGINFSCATPAGGVGIDFTPVQVSTPPMTSNTAPAGYTASCSSCTPANAWPAFGTTYPQALTNAGDGGWVRIQLPTAINVTSYKIGNGQTVTGYIPNAWLFQGSNDGTNFTTIDTQTGQAAGWAPGAVKEYFVTAPTTYNYFRFFNLMSNTPGNGSRLYATAIISGATPINKLAYFSTTTGDKLNYVPYPFPLTLGTAGQVLTVSGAGSAWTTPAGGAPIYVAMGAGTAVDWSAGDVFYKTGAAGGTLTFTNPTNGKTIILAFENTAATQQVLTLPTMRWPGGNVVNWLYPTALTVFTITYINGNYYATYVENLK